MSLKRWIVNKSDKNIALEISNEFNIDPLAVMILMSRGYENPEDIAEFILDDGQMTDPFQFVDMDKAVNRIKTAISNNEMIAIYGDYDVDGISSCVLLNNYLKKFTSNITVVIPDRQNDGYGMNINSVKKLKDQGVSLIITVDNGISCIDEIDYANSIGIDVVVTDHHLPGERLPNALAVVDPQRYDCPSEFKEYAGVGVAFKLICALEGCACEDMFYEYAPFVALGTIADIMPLKNENRTLVKAGIKQINNFNNKNCIGIHALMEVANAKNKALSSGQISFMLTPRLNAVGRMQNPMPAFELLCEKDYNKALELAEFINGQNILRQETERKILDEADKYIVDNRKTNNRVIVAYGENWHQGVLGIVASKLLERYRKPVIVLSKEGEQVHGSARSLEGFQIHEGLKNCSDLLIKFGGHKQAAGLTLLPENIEIFDEAINKYAADYSKDTVSKLIIDCPLKTSGVNLSTAYAVSSLAPFGADNPLPVFALLGVRIENITPIGGDVKTGEKGKHLKINVSKNGICVNAVKFYSNIDEFPYSVGEVIDLAITIEVNVFKGCDCLSVIVKDIRLCDDADVLIDQRCVYESFLRDELDSSNIEQLIPTRNNAGLVYTALKNFAKRNKYVSDIEHIYLAAAHTLSFSKIKNSLDILKDIGVIDVNYYSDHFTFRLNDVKSDFESSKFLNELKSKVN